MNTQYYVELDGQQFGPYTLEQMRTFELMPNVKVYSTITKEWAPVELYPELAGFVVQNETPDEDIDIYNATYYLRLGTDNYGPYSLPEISFLDIEPDSLLSVDNMQSWQRAGEINGLLSAIDLMVDSDNVVSAPIVNMPNSDELEEIIEEQENEIFQLNDQLAKLQSRLNDTKEYEAETSDCDYSVVGAFKYAELGDELCKLVKNNIPVVDTGETVYRKVFPSIEIEKLYYIEEYSKFINCVKNTLNIITEKTQGILSSFENDIILLDNSTHAVHKKCIKDSNQEERALIEMINQQIESIRKSADKISISLENNKNNHDNSKDEKIDSDLVISEILSYDIGIDGLFLEFIYDNYFIF